MMSTMLNSLDDNDGLIWLDGELLPWRQARLHVLTHSLHMGGAVFEGMRAYDGHVFLNIEHLERLQRSATMLDYHLPWSQDELTKAIEAVLWANQLDNAYIRPVAWRGAESVSIASPHARIHVAIAAWTGPRQRPRAAPRTASGCTWRVGGVPILTPRPLRPSARGYT